MYNGMKKEAWLEERKRGIGGSDIAAIVGVSPWKTPRQVWLDKKGMSEPQEETPAQHWGNLLEDVVAQEFARIKGWNVLECQKTFEDAEFQFLRGNVDRLISKDGGPVLDQSGNVLTDCLLEIKTSRSAADWADGVPVYYESQVQWYMMLTGCKLAYVAVLIGKDDFRVFEVERDEKVIAFLRKKGVDFWKKYIETNVMPDAETLEDCRVFRGVTGEEKTATPEVMDSVERIRELNEKKAEIEEEISAERLKVCEFMKEAVKLKTEDGKNLCTWTASKDGETVDWKTVAEEMTPPAELVAKHTKKKKTPRMFRVSK